MQKRTTSPVLYCRLLLSVLRIRLLKFFRRLTSGPQDTAPTKTYARGREKSLGIDITRATRQLKHDLKDDWFPDPLGYEDILSSEAVVRIVESNIERNAGHYLPEERDLFDIPKSGFTLRYALETGVPDRVIYHGLVSFLTPYYDRLLPWNVFSHRFDREKRRSRDKYFLKPGIDSWKHFLGATESALRPGSYLVSTDVSNYFEHINVEQLKAEMSRLEPELQAAAPLLPSIRKHRELLFSFLTAWTYATDRGLPQNRDASSILANIYMRRVDMRMLDLGFSDRYFRYMDDIKVVCNDEFEARRALQQLTISLRELGLSLNAKKTKIIPASAQAEIADCLEANSESLQQIDELWRKNTRESLFKVWPILRDRTIQLIGDGHVDSREFRFCINRIALLARFKDLHFPSHLYKPVTAAICKAIIDFPANTDRYVQYLHSVELTTSELAPLEPFLRDRTKSIYDWQNYRLWLCLAEKGVKSGELIEAARREVQDGVDGPSRAGASVCLGVMGADDDRLEIAQRFGDLDSYLGQRTALIAIHELPYSDIKVHLNSVRADLLGVYRTLSSHNNRGKYFAPRTQIPIELRRSEEAAYE